MDRQQIRNLFLFCLAFVCGGVTLFLAEGTGLPPQGQRLLALLSVIMVLWSTACVSLGASCLLLLVLMVVSVVDYSGGASGMDMEKAFRKSLGGFTSFIPMVVISGTAFASALRSSGLAERTVYTIMKAVTGKSGKAAPGRILAAIFLAELPISLMIPAAIGRCAIYMSVAEGFGKPMNFVQLDSGKPFNPFQKAVWIGLTITPIIMGAAFLTGAEATIMAGTLISETTGLPQYWGTTLFLLFLPALGAMVIAWAVLFRLFPSNTPDVDSSMIVEKLRSLGPLCYKEKYCLTVLLSMVFLFLTDTVHGVPAPLIVVFMCFVLFIPGVGAGNWKQECKNIAWEGAFIIAVALGFSALLGEYGVMDYFAGKIATLNLTSYSLVLLAIIVCILVVRLGIASIASSTALLVPVSLAVASGANLTPEQVAAVGWIGYIFCRLSFFLPHQGAHVIMTYSRGFYATRDLARSAVLITAGCVALYFFWALFCMVPILQFIR